MTFTPQEAGTSLSYLRYLFTLIEGLHNVTAFHDKMELLGSPKTFNVSSALLNQANEKSSQPQGMETLSVPIPSKL